MQDCISYSHGTYIILSSLDHGVVYGSQYEKIAMHILDKKKVFLLFSCLVFTDIQPWMMSIPKPIHLIVKLNILVCITQYFQVRSLLFHFSCFFDLCKDYSPSEFIIITSSRNLIMALTMKLSRLTIWACHCSHI